jgi:FAD:protein FMN transferase
MGVEVVVAGADEAELAAVRRLFGEWDRVFSRFRADSELSRVNRAGSPVVAVSPLFARAVRTALAAAAATEGLVDPTLGLAIEAAGYDRDLSLLGADDTPPGPTAPGRWRSIRVAGRLLSGRPGHGST